MNQEFRAAVDTVFALPMPPDDLDALALDPPNDRSPTQDDLEVLTEKQIDIERRLAGLPQEFAAIDAAGSELALWFQPLDVTEILAARAGLDPTTAPADVLDLVAEADRAAEDYRRAETWLRVLRERWATYQVALVGMLGVTAAARAKAEHDLAWQQYVRERFGTEPSDIERRSFEWGSEDALGVLAAMRERQRRLILEAIGCRIRRGVVAVEAVS